MELRRKIHTDPSGSDVDLRRKLGIERTGMGIRVMKMEEKIGQGEMSPGKKSLIELIRIEDSLSNIRQKTEGFKAFINGPRITNAIKHLNVISRLCTSYTSHSALYPYN